MDEVQDSRVVVVPRDRYASYRANCLVHAVKCKERASKARLPAAGQVWMTAALIWKEMAATCKMFASNEDTDQLA